METLGPSTRSNHAPRLAYKLRCHAAKKGQLLAVGPKSGRSQLCCACGMQHTPMPARFCPTASLPTSSRRYGLLPTRGSSTPEMALKAEESGQSVHVPVSADAARATCLHSSWRRENPRLSFCFYQVVCAYAAGSVAFGRHGDCSREDVAPARSDIPNMRRRRSLALTFSGEWSRQSLRLPDSECAH